MTTHAASQHIELHGAANVRDLGGLHSSDGRVVIRMTRTGAHPEEVGAVVARALLVEGGGAALDGFDAAAVSERRASG